MIDHAPWAARRRAALVFGALLALAACRPAPRDWEPSFYYWRADFHLSPAEAAQLARPGLARLYTRFFDLDYDAATARPQVRAPLRRLAAPGPGVEVVPVVYITSELFRRADAAQRAGLPRAVASQVRLMLHQAGLPPPAELQLDHDWAGGTREAYFAFLRGLRAELPGVRLSATIRLHQLGRLERVGVPPVDAGVLMAYHSGDPARLSQVDSILDAAAARAYLKALAAYPLTLDLALPAFHWVARFDAGGRLRGLQSLDAAALAGLPGLRRSGRLYGVTRPLRLGDWHLQGGETLRVDAPDLATLGAVRDAAAAGLKPGRRRLILYPLDEGQLRALAQGPLEALDALYR
jgi:hypothetical protein